MITRDQLYIGGQWVPPSGTGIIEVICPSTEEVVGRVPDPTTEDIDLAVAAARRAFDEGPWPRLRPAERAEHLRRLAKCIEERADEIGHLITLENGTPVMLATAAQVLGGLGQLRVFADLAESFPWEEVRTGPSMTGVVAYEPVGVVAAISPWNGPLVLSLMKLGPALAAGCTVVLKPPPETPLHAYVFAEACEAAGFPDGVLSILPGGREVGQHLVSHPDVDKVAFTGSTAAGRQILAACADTMKRVTLELGGKSAAIVLDDVDVAELVPQIMPWMTMLSGQMCLLMSRVLVPRARHDEIVVAICEGMRNLKLGDPFDPENYLGPLISERQRDRVEGYIALGKEEGATLVLGGGRPEGLDKGWYVEPTVFTGVSNSMRIAREEIFGPVIVVIPYDTVDEAVAIANDTDFGLAGGVFTADPARGLDVARLIRTGTYGINTYGTDPTMPFGGCKQSGLGRESGVDGLSAYLEAKTIALPAGFVPAL